MNLDPVIIAIPMFFTLMGIEIAYEAMTKKRTYRLNDAITNISTGTIQQVSSIFFKVIKVGIYVLVFEKLAIFEIPPNWLSFVVLFILFDFGYYWEHRWAHTVSLFWGGHSVHHQSEDYNLSVALRQSSTAFLWSFPIYLPLAIVGFDPTQFVLVGGFNLLYQFWIHTEHIKKMPRWFEAVMNTPSHHRVHHGRNPQYIDKNYAGVFITWDRMFGTFEPEKERPVYGITKPLASWNPIYANFAHYIDLFKLTKKSRNFSDTLKMLFFKPGWQPEYLGGVQTIPEIRGNEQKFDTKTTLGINLYVLLQFALLSGATSFFLFNVKEFDAFGQVFYTSWIILTTLIFGFLFETKGKWSVVLEILRLICIPVGLFYMQSLGLNVPMWGVVLGGVFAVFSFVLLLFLVKRVDFIFEREN